VAAALQVHVPAINCRAVLSMTFPASAESTRQIGQKSPMRRP
jgi:hypothetical protein